MSFLEQQFPMDIALGGRGGPQFSTSIAELQSGHEQRNINWSIARAKYNVAHGVKTEEQLAELIAFFRAVKGRATGFRFRDWSDYLGEGEVIGTGNGSTTAFQLIRSYTAGVTTVTRAITKPVSGSVSIYIDSVLLNSGYTVNHATGVVTFSSPPNTGDIISADFEFDVPVRFDTDQLSASLDDFNSGGWKDIPLVEVRV